MYCWAFSLYPTNAWVNLWLKIKLKIFGREEKEHHWSNYWANLRVCKNYLFDENTFAIETKEWA